MEGPKFKSQLSKNNTLSVVFNISFLGIKCSFIILLCYSVYPSMQLSKHRGYEWGHISTCTLVVWLVRNVCLVEPCSSSGLAEVDVEHTSEQHFPTIDNSISLTHDVLLHS